MKFPRFILFLLLLSSLVPFQQAFAAQEGLVPCGGQGQPPCQLCHFFVLGDRIIDFLILPPQGLVFLIAALLIVIGGVMFLVSSGSPSTLQQAKDILKNTVFGLVIIYAAWLVINLFFVLIGVADWTGLQQGWFQIQCSIK